MEPPDLALTVYFDGDCGLCRRVAAWLDRQPQYVPVHCVAAREAASTGCPIDLPSLLEQVTVVATDGAVYRGTNAWIVVLWALRRHRHWSLWFATTNGRRWAERLFASVTGFAARTRRRPAGS